MTNDQLDQQVVELDNLNEHREIVTFMRRSSPLNTSQRTALEQYGHMILEYPVGDLRQQFEHPERPLTVEIGFGMGRSLVLMAQANPLNVTMSGLKCMFRGLRNVCMKLELQV
jgi:tRNA (guanine-N7-)-methyltransferase